ncbi:MAG: HEAT repeat domain-containing protein [Opitutaceae bacterium]|nr:HEAT repeat domain-containing protein [Opitutaceae bacterium]
MNSLRILILSLFSLGISSITLAVEWDEAGALAVLASDTQMKARACQALAVVGGPESVLSLAALLGNQELASYARTALEVIDDPSAGKALRAALPNLNGRLLSGVITSLGVRGDEAAVPAIQQLAVNADTGVAKSALAALARIGTEEAISTIVESLNKGPSALRISAAHAALAAAEELATNGNDELVEHLLKSIQSAVIPDYIKIAASTLTER